MTKPKRCRFYVACGRAAVERRWHSHLKHWVWCCAQCGKTNFYLQSVPADALLRAVNACDGHTIVRPEFFTHKKIGLPAWFVAPLVQKHRSDGSPKGTIFNDRGEALLGTEGVYMLDFLWHVARFVRADLSGCSAMGRGFLARQLQAAIRAVDPASGEVTFHVEQPLTGKSMKTIKVRS
jgi:hypothetical protein